MHKVTILTCKHSYPVGLCMLFLARAFIYFYTLCMQAAKALSGEVIGRAGCSGLLLLADDMSIKMP